MTNRLVFSLTTAAFLASAIPVFAQSAQDAPVPPQATEHRHDPERHFQHRLEAFHDRLGITTEQQPQWDALVATMRTSWESVRQGQAAQALRGGQVHGVAAIKAEADLSRDRAEAMQRVVPAVDNLYNVLTPQQRQVADQSIDHFLHRGPHHPG